MNLTSRAIVRTLSWTLVAAIILGIVNCDSLPSANLSSNSTKTTDLKSNDEGRRSPRKYLELDDLNRFESPAVHIAKESSAAEELADEQELAKKARPKKFVKRSARVDDGTSKAEQQQRQRVARQNQNQKKQRPGFFWTLFRVTFESFNDTRSAIQQISQILNDNIKSETTTRRPSASLKKPPTAGTGKSLSVNGTAVTTEAPPETSTEFQLTRPVLMSLIRRNVKGLVRLFNIEWRDALNQSETNVKEFRQDLGKQIGMYLQDNPNAY